MQVAVIGAGAAGCFCAIELRRRLPYARVTVLGAGPRPLAKVALTGGGRCNLTNTFQGISKLDEAYPRGASVVKNAFKALSPEQTFAWWENAGVPLTVQPDGCVFPESQDAMQIVRTLERLMRESGVDLQCAHKVTRIREGFLLDIEGKDEPFRADAVLLAAGGLKEEVLRSLLPSSVEVTPTIPSLFTLKVPNTGLNALMGTVVPEARLKHVESDLSAQGILLITDWGLSGPATLKLSSYAARELAQSSYKGTVAINWLGADASEAHAWTIEASSSQGRRQLSGYRPEGLSDRLWEHILKRAGADRTRRWAEISKDERARIELALTDDRYPIDGRARFKEEFVTCGGVSLDSVNRKTLESKTVPGLFFSGEVLDIDAITGGFNLQAAWSTGYMAAIGIFSYICQTYEKDISTLHQRPGAADILP